MLVLIPCSKISEKDDVPNKMVVSVIYIAHFQKKMLAADSERGVFFPAPLHPLLAFGVDLR